MRIALLIVIASGVAACSSGGGQDTSTGNPPPAVNNAPTISGVPPGQVTEGQLYSFTPTASDADGDTLTFSIGNQPGWANFDTATGTLAGTPNASHIGTTTGVTISVSDGTDSASLAPFDIEVRQIQLGSAVVSWDIPTTNADGSTLDDLAGFNVHYRRASDNFSDIVVVNDAAASSVLIEDLSPDTWFFAVSAFDQAGNRSALSPEVSKVVSP